MYFSLFLKNLILFYFYFMSFIVIIMNKIFQIIIIIDIITNASKLDLEVLIFYLNCSHQYYFIQNSHL